MTDTTIGEEKQLRIAVNVIVEGLKQFGKGPEQIKQRIKHEMKRCLDGRVWDDEISPRSSFGPTLSMVGIFHAIRVGHGTPILCPYAEERWTKIVGEELDSVLGK